MELLCVGGMNKLFTGNSLLGLCQRQCNQIQAGESSPHLPAPTSWFSTRKSPGQLWEEHRRSHFFPGTLPKPFIWADPGTIITMGRPVTIWCQGSLQAESYHLYKEQVSQLLGMWVAWNFRDKARFSIKSMSPNSAGQFQCIYNSSSGWSERSDYLQLVVTGMYSKPSFSAHPSPIVASGGNVSLLCNSKDTMDTFHLLKEGGAGPPQHRESRFSAGRHQAVFPVDSVNISHGGIYRCYGSFRFSSHVWSHPSDHVDLKVTGTFEKPSLSAHPGPSVTLGENVTLQCRSESWCDTFHLFKEGFIAPPQHLHWQNNTGPFQVNFTMSLVNSVHAGTYRCYSSHSTSPYLLSQPSDPLELIVSEAANTTSLSKHKPDFKSGANVTSLNAELGTMNRIVFLKEKREGKQAES
ncbi:leukocyte immunoglobulin-like receptor subfamily A member 6 isoform X2 [Trichechus manatus latirostris]|uniref:Leukocyte immunoglobulin-like receptor subfamily A member 6 isoform X2 n=1 Tax=Trichechus manatus latirostris TaxID=127582 RepID=A0A2Y9RF58_TRIMA|nr:leukocyte immunoglobulin-like receptor subfamily A member 6 isoform X2 [Trichechus manatus latirostris]